MPNYEVSSMAKKINLNKFKQYRRQQTLTQPLAEVVILKQSRRSDL